MTFTKFLPKMRERERISVISTLWHCTALSQCGKARNSLSPKKNFVNSFVIFSKTVTFTKFLPKIREMREKFRNFHSTLWLCSCSCEQIPIKNSWNRLIESWDVLITLVIVFTSFFSQEDSPKFLLFHTVHQSWKYWNFN